jgi:hypothetical protein
MADFDGVGCSGEGREDMLYVVGEWGIQFCVDSSWACDHKWWL